MPNNRTASKATSWSDALRDHLSENGRIRYGALQSLSDGTGLTVKALRNALTEGFPPRNEGAFVLAIAKHLGLDAVALLHGRVRPVGDAVESGVRMTGDPKWRPVLLMAKKPAGRAELMRLARAWCKRHGLS